jgi:hypothetical protein
MTSHTHTDVQALDPSEIAACPSQPATAITPAPDAAADQAVIKRSDHTMGIATTFDEAVNLDHRRLPGKLTSVALFLPDDLPHEQWLAAIETLNSIEQSRAWWWGDALNFGERQYDGKMYEQAIADTGLSYNHLAHAKLVARRFEFWRRRQNLTWSHHREVAGITDDAEQDRLLDEAERSNWSKKALRTVVGQRHPKTSTPTTAETPPKTRRALANEALASDRRVADVLKRVTSLSADERAVVADAIGDRRGVAATSVEEAAVEEDDDSASLHGQCVDVEIEGGETARTRMGNGDDAAALDGADGKQGRADGMTEPDGMATAGKPKKPPETPDPEEREDVGQEGKANRNSQEQVATRLQLQIYPKNDPYSDEEPLWALGGLQSAALIASILPQIPDKDRIIGLVLQLIDALAPALLEAPIPQEQRGKLIGLLRGYCGYKDFADQLLACLAKADAAIAQAQIEMFPQESSATAPGSEDPRLADAG